MHPLELLAPSRCLACRCPGPRLCDPCRASLVPVGFPRCARCGRPTAHAVDRCRECASPRPAFDRAQAAFRLEGAAPPLVRSWKDRGLRRAGALVGELVLAAVAPVVADAVVPVPPAPARARRRGVDGPAQLATALAGGWGLPPPMSLLARTGARPQRDLARDERRRNARSSFSVSHAGRASPAPPLDGAVVLLVDDVYTTGATADACARLLRRLGASRVEVVTFARVVR